MRKNIILILVLALSPAAFAEGLGSDEVTQVCNAMKDSITDIEIQKASGIAAWVRIGIPEDLARLQVVADEMIAVKKEFYRLYELNCLEKNIERTARLEELQTVRHALKERLPVLLEKAGFSSKLVFASGFELKMAIHSAIERQLAEKIAAPAVLASVASTSESGAFARASRNLEHGPACMAGVLVGAVAMSVSKRTSLFPLKPVQIDFEESKNEVLNAGSAR
jgi:hypothetical protein